MRLIIEARPADEDCDVVGDDGVVIVIERRDRSLPRFCTLSSGLPQKCNPCRGRPLIEAGFKPVKGFHV
jgi:hypothetical protein